MKHRYPTSTTTKLWTVVSLFVLVGAFDPVMNQPVLAFECTNAGAGVLVPDDGGTPSALACGTGAVATGGTARTAVGGNTAATGQNATAVGHSAIATMTGATAVGRNAQATSNNHVTAVGAAAVATGTDATAVGQSADATTGGATALGQNAQATTSMDVTAVGVSAVATGTNGTALGANAQATTNSYVTAVGAAASATGWSATALGHTADATSSGATAIGKDAEATTNAYVTAIGTHSIATGEDATALGAKSRAAGNRSIAIGANAEAWLDDELVLGTATNTYTAPGIDSTASEATQASNGLKLVTSDADGHLATPSVGGADIGIGATWELSAGTSFIVREVGGNDVFSLDNAGNLVIAGSITTTGNKCGNGCDLVFDADYDLPSIEKHANLMWKNKYLPNVGPTLENAPFNLSDKVGRLLNELEVAHIYIERLNQRLEKVEQLSSRLALIESNFGGQ